MRVALVSLLLAGCSLTVLLLPTSQARPDQSRSTSTTKAAAATPSNGRLRFGIYPWGSVGCLNQCSPPVAENATKALSAVKRLKGTRAFVAHIFAEYNGGSNASADGLVKEAAWWGSNGLKVAAVLRYRPQSTGSPAGYQDWVRTQARRLAALPGTLSIQIANEPTNPAAGAGDGSYPGVIEAIASAVPAAREEVVAAGRQDILIGFNWDSGLPPATTEPFWSALKTAGGAAFTQAVGFVGVNIYPGTWTPPLSSKAPTTSQIWDVMYSTLHSLRHRHMVAAGVPQAAIIIGETGYPTSAKRSAATQERMLKTIIEAADRARTAYGVTDLYGFGLRDARSASGLMEDGYGVLRDDYTAKPAFNTLRSLIAQIGA
ncbi:MAG TPA: hypothetical protein VNA28_02865 [Solirubrobacteraceae bacterium]|nr:hypothetical protein [Solirubrobacteraceae bacterium]